LSLLPLSIPSPPIAWQIPVTIPIGQWLHGILPFVPANQVIAIHSYALCILLGIILATIWVNQRLKARGVEPGVVLDVIIWAVPLGLVGARLYHVFTHPGDYFYAGADPWNISAPGNVWAIWDGGNALFGSLIGGALGAWIGCRIAGLRFWTFADALAPAMLLAQALGRFGNYFNHELFGQPTDLPWGLEIESTNAAFPVGLPAGTLFHPTFLYEMLWNAAGILILLAFERKHSLVRRTILGLSVPVPLGGPIRLQWGRVWALYMIWYGIGRAWFESIRVDPSEIFFGLRTNVWGAIFTIVGGIILFAVQARRHPGIEPSPYLPGREWNPDGAVDSGETYSDTDEPGDDAAAHDKQALDKSAAENLATSGAGTKP
jgi:prolipoprotein diacylglyceryl transferase